MSRVDLKFVAGVLAFSLFGFSLPSFSGPDYGFIATKPVKKYDKDPEAFNPEFQYGVFKTSYGYQDPDFEIALALPAPMENPEFQSYNIIIEVNSSETDEKSNIYGPPQTMRVYSRNVENDKKLLYFWNISSGIKAAPTRKGYFRPTSFSSSHWSSKYDVPMLYTVFFDGGRGFHSSIAKTDLDLLGKQRASHGCIHVEDYRAEQLFHIIGQAGYGKVDVIGANGKIEKESNGQSKQSDSYKTLVIIR